MNEQSSVSPRVLAVLVTHNGRPWLEACLDSVASQTYPALSVMVVDNASAHVVAPRVRKILPGAEFLPLDHNVGFGAAANRALETSEVAPEADYYLFLHDDVVLDPECVARLVATALETEAGIVGGKGLAWDRPEILLEVGMSADQFGYPFSGLEQGEIDQGQHDGRREVLYATSACILVGRTLVERCGSWDGGYFAFGEDLDLCLRARLSGFRVFVEASAQFRHAVALANRIREVEGARDIRFYTRRNRARTIAKNVAVYRTGLILALYSALALGEIVVLAALRRFDEIPAYPRALTSFVVSLPDVVRRRRAVQKRRTVPDRRVRRFMVSDVHRARVFLEHHLREWESGTLQFGARAFAHLAPSALRARLSAWVRRPTTAAWIVILILLGFGMRKLLFGGVVASGGLWPFPEVTGRLLGDYLAGWRDRGLGTEAAAPAAFPLLWLAGVIALGRPPLAQIALVATLIGFGLAGINRFMRLRTKAPAARIAAVAVYSLAPAAGLAAGTGDLGALALYAGFPWMLEIGLRMTGMTPGEGGDRPATPPTTDAMTRDALRLALIAAAVVALAPSAFLALAFVWLLAGLYALAAAWDRSEALRRSGFLFGSLVITALLLSPWSLEAFRSTGAILAPLASGRGGGAVFGPLWAEHGFSQMLLLDAGRGWPARVVAIAAVLGAQVLPGPSRRRESRMLVTLGLGFALLGGAVGADWIPAPVASPALWLVVPLAATAAIAGHLVAGVGEELPRRALGWRHAASLVVVLCLPVGIFASWVPALAEWPSPESTRAADSGEEAHSILSFFISTAEQVGGFRVLWLGESWVDAIRSGTRRITGTPYLLTGPQGLTMLDAYASPPAAGEERLDVVVAALAGRRLHLAGHLLAPAGIRYIVVDVDDAPLMAAMGRQRDIALQQQQGGVAIFQNIEWLPRAVLAPSGLERATPRLREDRALMLVEWSGGRAIPARSQARFRGDLPRTRHSLVLLGDNFNPGWEATVGGRRLDHSASFGWANRFDLPKGGRGELLVAYSRRWVRLLWVAWQGLALTVAIVMARVGAGEIKGRPV